MTESSEARELSARRLVAAFQAGESSAFDEIYLRYAPRVHAYLDLALNDRYEAEDLTQDVFAAVSESLHRFSLDRTTAFEAWLMRIAGNRARNAIKAKRPEVREPSLLWVSQAGFDGDPETRMLSWRKGILPPCQDQGSTPKSCLTAA